jgi:diguanylate cyclase (GGDEF)-like protein
LPNRWLLNERLTRALALAIRHRTRLAVLFLDLDGFKEINDSFGHAEGDKVLREISGRLERSVRASDTVSRIGGDEFVVLLAELEDEKDVAICVEKIMKAVTAPMKMPSQELSLTLSIGIGIYPGDGEDPESLIRSADTAMYRAKAEGRGKCQFFRNDMNVVLPEQRVRA